MVTLKFEFKHKHYSLKEETRYLKRFLTELKNALRLKGLN